MGDRGSVDEAAAIAARIGYPVLVRPSYVLGGRSMRVCYDAADIPDISGPVLVDRFLENAIELDVDALCDGRDTYVAAVMEHVESPEWIPASSMLHYRGDVGVASVAECIDVELDRVFEEAIDQNRAGDVGNVGRVVTHTHRTAAEHVGRPNEHRVADARGNRRRLIDGARDPPLRAAHSHLVGEARKALMVLRKVDGVVLRTQDAEARALDRARQLEGGLSPELDTHATGCSRSSTASTASSSSGSK